ncbi:MAG: DNA methyltransferase, partial [Deltaproteobacteria bacterium]|nr:DNA methyltransferase [Deltaproteobacteria bacterium]
LFKKIGEYGKRLVDLHLLKPEELGQSIARFQGKGDNKVEKLKYEKGKLFINNDQYFEGILPEVWEYRIGGYQVLDKWLKDRKDRALSLDDIKHYCGIVAVLKKTIEIQDKIDSIYPGIEKSQG